MAVAIGKRKRKSSEESRPAPDGNSDGDQQFQDLFRRAFEKKFKPLAVPVQPPKMPVESDSKSVSDDESDWDGLESEEKEEDPVEIVEHNAAAERHAESQTEKKAFMNFRPPKADTRPNARAKQKEDGTEDEKGEKLNLKNDLALHRLINESHLLHPSNQKDTSHKQKIMDMRMKTLGSKDSFLQQKKMPMSHRKGMIAKASEREDRRRRDAKENGVILEKAKPSRKKDAQPRRERGVGGPSIGKYKGGTLSLSKRDVASIKRG